MRYIAHCHCTRYDITHTVTVLDTIYRTLTVLDTIYRTLSQYSIRYIAHCHSTRYDISHNFIVLDTIYSTRSQYSIRYIALSQYSIQYTAHFHSTRYDISHTFTVLDTIHRTLSQYSIRYIVHFHSIRWYITHFHSTRYDISHSLYSIRYIAHFSLIYTSNSPCQRHRDIQEQCYYCTGSSMLAVSLTLRPGTPWIGNWVGPWTRRKVMEARKTTWDFWNFNLWQQSACRKDKSWRSLEDSNPVMTVQAALCPCSSTSKRALIFGRSPSFFCLKTALNWNRIYISSPYRAVNTLPLGYKNQSVKFVQGNNFRLLWDPRRVGERRRFGCSSIRCM